MIDSLTFPLLCERSLQAAQLRCGFHQKRPATVEILMSTPAVLTTVLSNPGNAANPARKQICRFGPVRFAGYLARSLAARFLLFLGGVLITFCRGF